MHRVKMVVVGLNFGNNMVADILRGTGAEHIELAGLCDLDKAKLAAKSAEAGVPAYASLDDALATPDVEAIGLFTGPAGRADVIRRCIRAGKHVMTTKPFERSADDAVDVLREARDLGRAVFLNSPSPVLPPDLATVERWRVEHALGSPVAARLEVTGSYNESADGSWYDDASRCPVAPIFRIGIYLINDAVRIFGEASEVRVLSSRLRTGRPTPDNAQLGILFRSGAIVNILASLCVDDGDQYRNAMTLNFERGTIYRNAGPIRRVSRQRGSEMQLVMNGQEGRAVVAEQILEGYNPHHVYQWDVFQRYVRCEAGIDTVAPEVVGAGIRIIEAMACAEKSGSGATVVLPIGGGAGE